LVRSGAAGAARAITRHAAAVQVARQLGDRCARGAGRTAEAEDRLRQALAILQRIGAAEAAGVSAELDAMPGTPDPASASL